MIWCLVLQVKQSKRNKNTHTFHTLLFGELERINFLGALEGLWEMADQSVYSQSSMDGTSHTFHEEFVSNDELFSRRLDRKKEG
jgi:hypothetical protein